jgi:putative membrane protein
MLVAFLPKLAEAFRQILPVLFISFIGGHGNRSELIVSAIGVLGGFGAIGAYVTTRFEVTESQIIYRTGWIFRKDRRIPLAQVQNVNLRQGLLERLLKVVTLELETAGGKGAELKLSVLSEAEAERLRVELMAEATHSQEAEIDEDVYRISRHDLLLGAVTEHHTIAFLISALPLIGFQRIFRMSQVWVSLPLAGQWIVGILATVMALVAGWLFGAWQYVMRYGGFTVRREPGVTRVAYGLLTKVQVAIRPIRIEYALISSTPWQRLVRRETLSVGTAGTFGEQGTVAKLALMIPREETPAAVEKVIPGLDLRTLDWQSFPRFYLFFVIVRGLLSLAIGSVFLIPFILLPEMPVRWFFLLIPLSISSAVADRLAGVRRAGYAVSEGFVAVRQGYFRQRVEIMPMAKVEVVMLHQPPWWRGQGLVSAGVKGMVHVVNLPMVPSEVFDSLKTTVRHLAAERKVPKLAVEAPPIV